MTTVGAATEQSSADPPPLVIEGNGVPTRLRRPGDLVRFVAVVLLAAAILGSAFLASDASTGLTKDIAQGANSIPHLLAVIANLVGAFGVLVLPIAGAIDLLVRKRGRQLLEALGAGAIALALVWMLGIWIQAASGGQLLNALTGRPTVGAVAPLDATLAATVAFIAVARLVDRSRWAIGCVFLVAAIFLANILTGGITVAALIVSALLGWAVGLLARWILGTPATRPSGAEVASALERVGFGLTVLRAIHETDGGRRYSATTRSGERLEVMVFDRDLEGGGIVRGLWRTLRMRESGGSIGLTMRGRLDHAQLQSYAAQAAGAPVPRLEAVAAVGPDAALLAYAHLDGQRFDEIGPELSDWDLEGAWRAIRTMHDSGISHRSLTAHNMLRDSNGGVWLLDPEAGSTAVGDVAERIDLAEMLCTLALLTDPDRALDTGRRVLGSERLSKALPVMQPVALTPETRKAIKAHKDVLKVLREDLEEITPEGSVEEINLVRLRPRTILMIVAGTIAAYFILIQLGSINLVELITTANWWWAAPALVLSAATFLGATMTLEGFVPEKLSFIRTTWVQLAGAFATLVSPPTLGSVGVNIRYLQKVGVHPALAAASVAVSQVMAFVMHLLLVLFFGVLTGSQNEVEVAPPAWAIVVGAIFLAALVLLFVLPFTRHWAQRKVSPILKQVGPRLLTLAQQPLKLARGISGFIILNIGFCFCLVACVRAFGGGGEWAAICVVYLVGATVGQIAPTPGGLGAVEAALTAGLAGVGVDGGIALSAVLFFRILTFWLPTIPGWFCFNGLVKRGYL
ncbi:MAG: lysylphosphatidylglycerol synthase transmembrane domain-containing protein [Actinomycetes bacterium]